LKELLSFYNDLSRHSHTKSSSIYFVLGNLTSDSVELITDSIKLLVKKAMTSNTLCEQFVSRAHSLNVSFLTIPGGLAASGAVCDGDPTYTTVYNPGASSTNYPTGQPSSSPTHPSHKRQPKMVTGGFMGFLIIVLLIWFLRFYPAFIGLFRKKEKKDSHLYDILVVVNDYEEAILENVKHQDIAFFRRMPNKTDNTEKIEMSPKSTRWSMNDTAELLERRMEVQFFDQYDLLGNNSKGRDDNDGRTCRSVDHALTGNQLVTKEVYVQEARLQMGMILRVKPSALYLKKHPAKEVPANVHLAEPEATIEEQPVIPRRKASTIFPSGYKDPNVQEGASVFSPLGHSETEHSGHETEGAFVRGKGFPENPTNLWGYTFSTKSSTSPPSHPVPFSRPKRASIIHPDNTDDPGPSPAIASWKKSNYTTAGTLASKEYEYGKEEL
jgi:hypothetical protein